MITQFNVGYFNIKEVFSVEGVYDITVSDVRTAQKLKMQSLSLMEYDQALDHLKKNPAVDCLDQLEARLQGVVNG